MYKRQAWNRAVLVEEAGGGPDAARAAWRLYLDRYGARAEPGHAAAARARLDAIDAAAR